MNTSTDVALAELVYRVTHDVLPERIDAFFIFAQNDLERELLRRVAKLHMGRPQYITERTVFINGLDAYESVPGSWGAEEWTDFLYSFSGKWDILTVENASHSGTEAQECAKLIKGMKVKNLVIVGTPYHLPRCFLNMIAALKEHSPETKCFCLTVNNINWHAQVEKSSVLLPGNPIQGTRFSQLRAELERIVKYRAMYEGGDPKISPIASPQEGIEYFLTR